MTSTHARCLVRLILLELIVLITLGGTEQGGLEVTLQTCILEVLGSNLCRITGYIASL
jgi:hypothetical protein